MKNESKKTIATTGSGQLYQPDYYNQKSGLYNNSPEYEEQMKKFTGVDKAVKNSLPPLDDVGGGSEEIADINDTNFHPPSNKQLTMTAGVSRYKAVDKRINERHNTVHDDQWFAIKRIHTIVEGHLQDKFTDPKLCHVINQVHEIIDKYLKGK